jgi:hypothetical protein
MSKNDLDQKAEELEQTLQKQLELFKKESEDWVKVGGAILLGGLLTYGIVKATRKRKEKTTEKALEVLEKEGLLNEDLKSRLTQSTKSSMWPRLSQRILLLALALAKDKIVSALLHTPAADGQEIKEGR